MADNKLTWTDEQVNFLRKHRQTMTATEIADAMGKPNSSVRNKAGRLGLKKLKRWTPGEEKRLKKLYGKNSLKELERKFARSKVALIRHARRIGLPVKEQRPLWDEKDTKYLIRNYQRMTAAELAAQLGRSKDSVYTKARILGLQSPCGG